MHDRPNRPKFVKIPNQYSHIQLQEVAQKSNDVSNRAKIKFLNINRSVLKLKQSPSILKSKSNFCVKPKTVAKKSEPMPKSRVECEEAFS